MSSSFGDYRDWANLPRDLLASIAALLYVPDYVRFRAVCASWLSAAAPPSRGGAGPLSPRMPYLLTAGKEGEKSEYGVLFNLADGRTQRLYPLPEIRRKWFVGSQDGWLAMLDEYSNVSLFNPFTRSQIHLPPITTLPFVEPVHNDADGSSISAYIFHQENLWPALKEPAKYQPVEDFRVLSAAIRKVVLSSNPSTSEGAPTVVAIFHFHKLMMFLRPGEKKWNFLDERDSFDDVIYHDGKFLAIGESHGEVFALDLNCDPPRKSVYSEGLGELGSYSARYLVESGGELLQVCRDSDMKEKNMFVVQSFLIMRLDAEKSTWYPLKSLGDRSLFLGNCYSISLSAQEIPGLRCNHIYFTDDYWDIFKIKYMGIVRDVGVYSIENGTVELCDHPELQLRWPPPVWITPFPWKF